MHSALDFGLEYPEEYKLWHNSSNTIITLAVKTEKDLWDLCSQLDSKQIKYTKFFEPDIGYSLTSITICPVNEGKVKKACSGIPLAGKVLPTADLVQKNQNELMDLCFNNREKIECNHLLYNKIKDLMSFIKDQTHVFKYKWKLPDLFFLNMTFLKENMCSEYEASKYIMFHNIKIIPQNQMLELLCDIAKRNEE